MKEKIFFDENFGPGFSHLPARAVNKIFTRQKLYSRDKLKQGAFIKTKKIFFDKTLLIKDRKIKKFKQQLFYNISLLESRLCLGHNEFKSVY